MRNKFDFGIKPFYKYPSIVNELENNWTPTVTKELNKARYLELVAQTAQAAQERFFNTPTELSKRDQEIIAASVNNYYDMYSIEDYSCVDKTDQAVESQRRISGLEIIELQNRISGLEAQLQDKQKAINRLARELNESQSILRKRMEEIEQMRVKIAEYERREASLKINKANSRKLKLREPEV